MFLGALRTCALVGYRAPKHASLVADRQRRCERPPHADDSRSRAASLGSCTYAALTVCARSTRRAQQRSCRAASGSDAGRPMQREKPGRGFCRKFPGAPVFALGYSLGALLLAKYLGEADAARWSPPAATHGTDAPSSSGADASESDPSSRSAASGVRAGSGNGVASAAAAEAVCGPSGTRSACVAGAATGGGVPGAEGDSLPRGSAAAGSSPGGARHGSMLAGAVAVSSPFDMRKACAKLDQPWTIAWLYNLILTTRCARSRCTLPCQPPLLHDTGLI